MINFTVWPVQPSPAVRLPGCSRMSYSRPVEFLCVILASNLCNNAVDLGLQKKGEG